MPQLKPANPIWQPGQAPGGCKLYLPLTAGSGSVVRDLSRRSKDGAFVGAVAWQRGPYGPQLGNFDATRYVAIDPPQQILGVIYPFWVATLVTSVNSGQTFPVSQGVSSSDSNYIAIRVNIGVGNVSYVMVDSASTNVTISVNGTTLNNGLPHVIQAVSFSNNDHRLYFDGSPIGSSTSSVSTFLYNQLTIGCLRRAVAALPFLGSILAFAVGNGAVPYPLALANDWLSGQFAAVRPRSRLAVFDLGVTAFRPHWRRTGLVLGSGAA